MNAGALPCGAIVTASFAHPADLGFTAMSFDPANAGAGFGTGWLAGLHISMNDLFSEWSSSAPPFVFNFDGIGSSYTVTLRYKLALAKLKASPPPSFLSDLNADPEVD